MARYSPELIKQTVSIFENRTGQLISEESARQTVENISGFFKLLTQWDRTEEENREESSDKLTPILETVL